MLTLPNFFGLWLSTSLGACILLVCVLGAWALYRYAKKKKLSVFFGLTALVLALGLVGFFAAQVYRLHWLIVSVILVVLGFIVYELWSTQLVPIKATRRVLVFGVALAIVLPLATTGYVYGVANANTKNAASRSALLKNYLETVRTRLVQTGDKLVASEEILPLTAGGDQKAAYNILRRELVNSELQLLILTDGSGAVIARGHSANVSGDLIQNSMPWLAPVFSGKSISGLGYTEDGVPATIYAVPITKGSRLLGTLVVGKSFSDRLLTASSDIIKSGMGVIATTGYFQAAGRTTDEKQRLVAPELVSWAEGELQKPRSETPLIAKVTSPTGSSHLTVTIQDTLAAGKPLAFVIAD